MSDCPLQLVESIFAVSTLEWETSDTVRICLRNTLPFHDLRRLEEIGVYKTSVNDCPSDIERSYDSVADGAFPESSLITLRVPRVVSRTVIAKDIDDLLSIPSACHIHPNQYLLTNGHSPAGGVFVYCENTDLASAPDLIIRYHNAIAFWALLALCAEHKSELNHLLYFGIRKTEIKPIFSSSDLRSPIAIDAIRSFVENPDRKETRREIFTSSLSEFLRELNPDRAFSHLLRESNRFSRRLKEALAVFLAEHSPEKLIEEARSKHFNLAEKIEKVISGIELKSLTIPAAMILIIKQTEAGESWSLNNLMIFISVSIYSTAMTIAHSSQLAVLRLMLENIDHSVNDLISQGLDDANPVISHSFKTLRLRCRNSIIGSWVMWFFCLIPPLAVIFSMFHLK